MEKINFVGVRKGAWTKEEDILLKNCIQKFGEGKWHKVPPRAGLKRCRKSCRLRWLNYLRPNIKKGYFTKDEVDLIIRLHKLLGNRWSLIAGRIPGRTANDVKNFWNTHILKKAGKYKKTTVEIKENILFKPRPRTFSISHVSSDEEAKDKKDDNGGHNQPFSFASILSQDGSVEFPSINKEVPFLLSEEEVDECIRWLFHTDEPTPTPTPGSFMLPVFCPTQINQKVTELSNLAIDAAFWDLTNLD